MNAARRRIGFIVGAGDLPLEVATAARAAGHDILILSLRGIADGARFASFACESVGIGQLGGQLSKLRRFQASELIFIGALTRPSLWQVRFDFTALYYLPELIRMYRGGDDHLLSGIAKFFERRGFTVRGPAEMAPELTAALGSNGSKAVGADWLDDIEIGRNLLLAMSPFDVGQGVIVANRRVLAVEGAEGTNGMIDRISELKKIGRLHLRPGTGVLVKAPKQRQDLRMDMPAIGPETVARAAAAGLAGIAVAAGQVLIANRAETIEAANRAGLFLHGFAPGGTSA